MFYDKQTKRKIQLLNLLIALLILIPIVLDSSKGFTIGFNSSFIGFENGLGKSSLQISTIKPDNLQLSEFGSIPGLTLSTGGILYIPDSMVPQGLRICAAIFTLLSLASFIAMIVMLVKLIRSVAADGLMNHKNIRRLRLLSYYMIAFYFISYIDLFIATGYYRSHLDLGGYTLCYPEMSPAVTIPFILLLLAEILNIAHKQREELDLTI